MAMNYTIDQGRLARFRADADAARGASSRAAERVRDARSDLTQAEAELRQFERMPPGQPRGIARRGEDGRLRGKFESQNDRYIADAQSRVEAARRKLGEASEAQADGAAARDHAGQLFARLDAYAKENTHGRR